VKKEGILAKKIDWNEVKEWDKKYHLKVFANEAEYQHVPIEHTEGDTLVMPDGTRLLDCLNQLVCVNAGQCHPKIQAAIREATERYGFVWEVFTTDYSARASKLLIEDVMATHGWAAKLNWGSSGSEAVEKALQIARLYTGRPLTVSRSYAYHGWTGGPAQCTRIRGYRMGISPTDKDKLDTHITPAGTVNTGQVIVAPAPHPDEQKGPDGKYPSVKYTEMLIDSYGWENIAAMITEPVFGASAIFPPPDYLRQIVKMLRERSILWICDEVLVGVGKMGKWFGYELFGEELKPDIMTCAKGIVSSAIPASCTVVSKDIADFMADYRWQFCGTFNQHPIAMAAVCANLEVLLEADAPKVSAKAGEYLKAGFEDLKKRHKTLGRVSGAGVLWALDLVKDKNTMEPFWAKDRWSAYSGDISAHPTNIIGAKAMEKGCLINGFTPNTLRFAVSIFVTKEDMDKAIGALDYALTYLDTLA